MVEDQGAEKTQVTAGSGEDAVLAVGIEGEAFAQVDGGSERALKGCQAIRGGRQCAGSEGDEFGSRLIGRPNSVTGEERRERARAAAGDLRRTETFFHQ